MNIDWNKLKSKTITVDYLVELHKWAKEREIKPNECPHCGWQWWWHGGLFNTKQILNLKCEKCKKYVFPKFMRKWDGKVENDERKTEVS